MPRVALPVDLDAQTRKTLDKFVNSASTPESLALRSRIVLAAADGSTNQQIAAALKIPPINGWEVAAILRPPRLRGLARRPPIWPTTKYDFETRQKVHTRVCQQPDDQSPGPYVL